MRIIHSERVIKVPKDVRVTVRSRHVRVKGARGTLEKSFRHLRIDLSIVPGGVKAELWFGDRKSIAAIRTVTSHIENMIRGVTKGFRYKMRMVYAHFPISIQAENDGKDVVIRNFLGEKYTRVVKMIPGVALERSKDVKDQIELHGNDINSVSQAAANLHCAIRVRQKDIRKFLDGVYVSAKGPAVVDAE